MEQQQRIEELIDELYAVLIQTGDSMEELELTFVNQCILANISWWAYLQQGRGWLKEGKSKGKRT